jgi:hypothetical protein
MATKAKAGLSGTIRKEPVPKHSASPVEDRLLSWLKAADSGYYTED